MSNSWYSARWRSGGARGWCRYAAGGSRQCWRCCCWPTGETVTVERLVEAVWDGDPPYGAVKAVRNCVSALRNRIAEPCGPVVSIQATSAGYRLSLEGTRLDARDFQRQVNAARQLADAGQAADAAAGLRAALALWRGPALAGTGSRIAQDCAARLDELRMTILEDCLDLELALGRHRQAVGELQALAREWPLRERVAGQLMLALYRSDRQAEALDTYLQLAKRLAEDLGIDPATDVTRRYEAILRQDPSLGLPRAPDHVQPAGAASDPRDALGRLFGHYLAKAADYQRRALAIFDELGDLAGDAATLANLGSTCASGLGYPEAGKIRERCRQ
jgi:DNA-binding SARP family transcriptional activator